MTVRRGSALALFALPLALATPATAARQAPAPPEVVVEPARQITDDPDPSRMYVIPTIAVHPTRPDTFVIGVGEAANGGCSLHVSHDVGLSWATTAPNFMPSRQPHCVQRNAGPVMGLSFASDGTLHVGVSGSSDDAGHPNGPVDALNVRTRDLGLTSEVSLVEKAEPHTYKQGDTERTDPVSLAQNSVAVDPRNPNIVYRGYRFRVRASEQVPNRPLVAVSTDGGRTWGKSVDPLKSLEGPVFGGDVPVLVVGNDGTVYGFTEERVEGRPRPPQRIFMFRSTDQGRTWTAKAINEGANTVNPPGVAIDRRTGALYVVYQGIVGPTSKPYFLASTDGGATWTTPLAMVDDGPPSEANQYYPGVSVAPNGRIDVAWHDFRNDHFSRTRAVPNELVPNPERWSDVYYSWSTDGGATWSENVRVTDRSIDRAIGATFNNRDVRGLVGIASTNTMALVTWPDSRAGDPPVLDIEDAYFTRVRFPQRAPGGNDDGLEAASAGAGAGAALALAGLVLLLGTRLRRPASG
ncbi:MAG: glycoside hydrolase [Actinomycetota bacterium]|nr:glycoside hydrolase [Actinomycetota bacterium]